MLKLKIMALAVNLHDDILSMLETERLLSLKKKLFTNDVKQP